MEIMTRIGVLKANDVTRKFKLYWLGGSTEIVEGTDIKDAFQNAGYGGGAVYALDYFENA